MSIYKTIESEILSYTTGSFEKSPGVNFSTYTTIKKISRFANRTFESGSKDSLGNDKYWYDICQNRIESERKNIDFDTKDIIFYSPNGDDSEGTYLLNLANLQWMRENNEGVKINEAIEMFSGWGNVVWKKIKDGYEIFNPLNFYVINQSAKTLDDTPVIERHVLTQSQLRAKKGIWKDDVIESCIKNNKSNVFQTTKDGSISQEFEIPYYEVFERNGEISVFDLKEAKGEAGDDKDKEKYVLAKIVVSGLKQQSTDSEGQKYVLFAEEISEMPYIEAHRGEYKGSWWREGMYEVLFDIQTRANEIGNQIASGLRSASKNIYRSSDTNITENVLTDLLNGDIIKSKDLQQVETRMNGMDQLIADWNRLMDLADRLCNSYEIVNGESPAGQPFRLGALLNTNANKLFGFIREKIGLAVQELYERWIMVDIIKDLKSKDVIKVTGDNDYFEEVCEFAAKGHVYKSLKDFAVKGDVPTKEYIDEAVKVIAEELKKKPELLVTEIKDKLKGIQPRVSVIITGENVNREAEMQTLATFIQLEQDPMRRAALIDEAMKKQGVRMPKVTQPVQQPQAPQPAQAPNQPLSAVQGNLQPQQV